MEATKTFIEAGTWTIDPTHTTIGFRVRHLMAAKVRGTFKSFSGTIEAGETPADSSASISIEAASIDTGVDDRDEHLRSPDFLNADEYPTLTFQSTGVRSVDGGFRVEGDLTIRGVTRPVELDVDFGGVMTDPWGNDKAIFSAETKIDREEWGLTWNQALETGGILVGKEVTIEIEAQATQA